MNANKYDDLADLISQETEFEWDDIKDDYSQHAMEEIKPEEKYLDRYFITDSIQNALTS